MSSAAAKGLFRIRRLRRSELPVNTVKLARYLIGKTLITVRSPTSLIVPW